MSEHIDVYDDDNFTLTLEKREGMLFVHCEVENFNKEVYKHIRNVFEEVKTACAYYGWTTLFSYTPNPKFARLMGGKSIEKFNVEGRDYEVMVWELAQL